MSQYFNAQCSGAFLLNSVCTKDGVLRRIFGHKRDKVTGEWRKLHNEELNDLYSLPNIVRLATPQIKKKNSDFLDMAILRDLPFQPLKSYDY